MKNKEIEKVLKNLEEELKPINSLEKLKLIRSKYLFRSEVLKKLKEEIKEANKNEIPLIGEKIKFYTSNVGELIGKKKKEIIESFDISKENILVKKNLKEITLKQKKGNIHPLTILTFQIQSYFDKLKFSYNHGNEIENEKFNFNFLNMPPSHPARNIQDTIYLKDEHMLLRTHATNMTSRTLFNDLSIPILGYSIGTVFRNDDNDATHSYQFNQIDIFALGKFSIANLKYVIDNLIEAIFEKKLKTRYRPSFFPFTEPSYEVDVECPNCNGKGCRICSNGGWIEILGAGMLHNNVIKNVGHDENKEYGFAAGIGLERLAMIKWNLNDIRDFFINDIKFLRRFN